MRIVVCVLAGLIGSFLLMLGLASFLDWMQGGGPGAGAMVFYASFVVSPLAGIAGGIWGAMHNEPPADGSAK